MKTIALIVLTLPVLIVSSTLAIMNNACRAAIMPGVPRCPWYGTKSLDHPRDSDLRTSVPIDELQPRGPRNRGSIDLFFLVANANHLRKPAICRGPRMMPKGTLTRRQRRI
jgi:hypothetical protein